MSEGTSQHFFSPSEGNMLSPDLKKKTVRLPPPEVLQNADPAVRYLLEASVEKQTTDNKVIDLVLWNNNATHKGFVKVNDRLDKVNGSVAKSKERLDRLELDKKTREDAELQKKADDLGYRNKMKLYCKWIIGLILAFSGSPYALSTASWLLNLPRIVVIIIAIQMVILIILLGIVFSRKKNSFLSTFIEDKP